MSEAAAPYVELACATNFSFLHGASHGSDLLGRALALGHAGLGICDRNTVAGVVRAWDALKRARAGVHETLKEPPPDFRLVTGARLVFADGTPDIIAYPEDRAGWGWLTRLLSAGNLRSDKGGCVLGLPDLLAHLDGLLLIVLPESTRRDGEGVARVAGKRTLLPEDAPPPPVRLEPSRLRSRPARPPLEANDEGEEEGEPEGATIIPFPSRHPGEGRGPVPPPTSRVEPWIPASAGMTEGTKQDLPSLLRTLRTAAADRVWLGAAMPERGPDRRRLARLARIAAQAGVPLLALNDALYAAPEDRPLQDVLTCIRLGVTIQSAGRRLDANAERHLKSPQAMATLFRDHPQALAEAMRLFARIRFDLGELRYEYPHEPVPEGWRPMRWLQHLTITAARLKWPDGTTRQVRIMLREEFRLIRRCNYAYYFLTVHDLVNFARAQDPPILCQGRGSAANSMVCYLLGVTSVDPAANNLLFSRFLSEERSEPPDIDVDFEHERREEVMQYVYGRYGRHRAGIVATVIHYRSRSAVREVGKALGLTEDVTGRLVSTVWGSFSNKMEEERFRETGFSLDNPEIERLAHFVGHLLAAPFPRHLSQHVGGFVLTEHRLDETVPIHHAAMADRTFIEWDKDDIDALGLMKVDVLALGMLTCLSKAFDLIRAHEGPNYTLASLPPEQPDVYKMLQKGDSIGVFQVESRAQMNMLPRLKPKEFYDLVVQVAIVRPGPIQGNMVHPYLRRRNGTEQVDYPSPAPPHPPDELYGLLGKTLGVPLFQEQAMKLAIVAAGFSPSEANQLRRAMATFRNVGTMPEFEEKMVGGMTRRGYTEEFARRCFGQIKGFGSYGFPESHAQSFGLLVYASAYIKCRHPAAFCAALLNSQPMGFYAPAQIVRDARDHDVEVREIDVMTSGWDNALEVGNPHRPGKDKPAVRLGFRQIDGFREEWATALVVARSAATDGFASIEALARAARLPSRALRLLADADAFRALGLDRREALWEARRTPAEALPLFAAAQARELGNEADPHLPAMPLSEHVAADYQVTRLSLKDHPMTFLRPLFTAERVRSCKGLHDLRDGARAKVAGVVLVRQRPGEGKAIFVTLEDETGVANILLWARDFEKYRRAVMAARLMEVHGIVQKSEEGVVHLMGAHVFDRTAELARLSEDHPARLTLSRADVFEHPQPPRHPGNHARHPRDVRILPASRDFH
ncbi:error-prone DNA polymerase [Sphingomonas nostoxanthinifaciens]|uniref:error-prone DNA polymerase n=1 Tax=Sphingomonas nostoxanthinifaciens TaxID=2872652 RepID=UPI001CC204E0|nr:error-prone DNA polymerase [Sphingomonas nostoxanthinifaciens]UAK26084.1 error-prone DNA polymerase [Sphingomonas nostoxanthinifaciens]